MSAPPPHGDEARPSVLRRIAYGLGATGLGLAASSDFIAVAGRHLGLHLLGSIELTQTGIVFLGAGAMLYATLERHHASVHMVTSRLSAQTAALLRQIMSVVSAAVFLSVAIGTAWVMRDLWNGYEMTELLHIPIRWLRALWLVASFAIAALFLRQAFSNHGGEA